MSDLLPCPFCGSPAFANLAGDKVVRGAEWHWTWEVGCEEGCVDLFRANSASGKFISKAEAVAAWNRRASPPVPARTHWRVSPWRDPQVVERRHVRRTARLA